MTLADYLLSSFEPLQPWTWVIVAGFGIYAAVLAVIVVAEMLIVHRHVKQAEQYQPTEWVWMPVNRLESVLVRREEVPPGVFWSRFDPRFETELLYQFWDSLCEQPTEEIEIGDVPQPDDNWPDDNWPDGVDLGNGDA